MSVSSPLSHMLAELGTKARAWSSWQLPFLALCLHADVQETFTGWWAVQGRPLTSGSSLILSLNFSKGESSGNGGGCVQVGLNRRWDVKSGTPWAMSHRKPKLCGGQQETTGPGVTLAVTICWEAGRLWWFSCSLMAASPPVPDSVCLGQSGCGTLTGSGSATKGDTSTSCSFTPTSCLSFPWNDCCTILYSSFLLSRDRFMDGGNTWTLHLGSSSSPHRIMVFEVVLAPEWTRNITSSNKYSAWLSGSQLLWYKMVLWTSSPTRSL